MYIYNELEPYNYLWIDTSASTLGLNLNLPLKLVAKAFSTVIFAKKKSLCVHL